MITRHQLVLSTAVVLTTIVVPVASQTTKATQAGAPGSFLTRLPSPVVLPADGPRQRGYCPQAHGRLRCPPILLNGGAAGGGLPTLDPAFKAHLPNIRVSLVIQSISHEVVANGGVP